MNSTFAVKDVTAMLNTTTADPQNTTTEDTGQISTIESPLASSSALLDARIMILKIGPAILIPVGTVGNVLTIFVLRKLGTDTSTMPLFFTALAVSDICLLYFGLLPVWLDFQFGYSLTASHLIACKLIFWVFYALASVSAWLLVIMTVQRAVSVVLPHKVSSTCTHRQAHVTIAAIIITIFLINSGLLYAARIHPESEICYFTFTSPYLEVFAWQDLLMSSLLPFCFLLLSNSVLIWKVLQSLRVAKAQLHSGQTEQVDVRQKKFMSMTITLIAVSAAFVILTSPIGILSLESSKAAIDEEILLFLASVANILWYTNSTINFFLYVLTGTRFRQELKRLLCVCIVPAATHKE